MNGRRTNCASDIHIIIDSVQLVHIQQFTTHVKAVGGRSSLPGDGGFSRERGEGVRFDRRDSSVSFLSSIAISCFGLEVL